jgi:O-6-methylguanine DNA methyltransferase
MAPIPSLLGELEEQVDMQARSEATWIGELSDSMLGEVWTAVSAQGLIAVDLWGDRERLVATVKRLTGSDAIYAPERVAAVNEQIEQYLAGERRSFDFAVNWSVLTPFQHEVLRMVMAIPFGQTRSYGEIAQALGKPGAMRAVGRANATNPMPLVIPCHRVLGADGRLHGYSAPGGLETKAALLRLEGSWLL